MTPENEIRTLLDRLADFEAQKDLLSMSKKKLVDEVMTPEIRERLAEIDAEFADQTEAVDDNIALLTQQIKKAVVAHGESVKSGVYHAVFVRGRVSWDTKKLEGLMMIVPQLKEAKSEGEPSVSLRTVK